MRYTNIMKARWDDGIFNKNLENKNNLKNFPVKENSKGYSIKTLDLIPTSLDIYYHLLKIKSIYMKYEKFNQLEYQKDWRKQHKVQFNVDMNPDEKEELVELIKQNGYSSYKEFLLSCTEILKDKNNIFRKKKEGIKNEKI